MVGLLDTDSVAENIANFIARMLNGVPPLIMMQPFIFIR